MPRRARYIESNGYYHIISRSINETWILKDTPDFIHFLKLIHEAKKKHPVYLFHYVLMNTRFHLILQAPSKESLSKNISYIKWHYTKWMKKKYAWKGPLWRERYKNLPIEDESYLAQYGTYVEFNPVRAGITAAPKDYPYSSYRKYYLGLTDHLIDKYNLNIAKTKIRNFDNKSSLARILFSHSPAIGSPYFIEKYKNHRVECPQK